MNPSLIRLDDESPFTSPTPVGQPLGEPVALTRTAAHRPLADGNGVTGIWECTRALPPTGRAGRVQLHRQR